MSRLATSADGTRIACRAHGTGPLPLVLVHGWMASGGQEGVTEGVAVGHSMGGQLAQIPFRRARGTKEVLGKILDMASPELADVTAPGGHARVR